MRRFLQIIAVCMTVVMNIQAENPATRYFSNNKGYVKVYYNRSGGKLDISSQTEMNIQYIAELQITITCTHKWQEQRGVRERGTNRVISPAKWNEELVTICDSRYTNIPVNKSISLSNGLADLPQDSNTDYFENFNVTISNPLLSSENEISTSENRVQENRAPGKENKNSASEKTETTFNNPQSETRPNNVCEPTFTQSKGNFCSVVGSSNNNTVSLKNTRILSKSTKSAYVEINLTKTAREKTYVIVELYDGNELISTRSTYVSAGYSSSAINFDVSEPNHTYTAKIIEASAE